MIRTAVCGPPIPTGRFGLSLVGVEWADSFSGHGPGLPEWLASFSQLVATLSPAVFVVEGIGDEFAVNAPGEGAGVRLGDGMAAFARMVSSAGFAAHSTVIAVSRRRVTDPVISRRFDVIVHLECPDGDTALRLIRTLLPITAAEGINWPRVSSAARRLSHAEIATAVEVARRRMVLDNLQQLPTPYLIDALLARRPSRPQR